MKRLLLGLPLALLLGCPLYDEDCSGGQECAAGFRCDGYSQRCVAVPTLPECLSPEECGASETCTPNAVCRPGSCDYHGCVAGYTCSIVDGVHACVAAGSSLGQDAGAVLDAGDAAVLRDASAVSPDPDAAAAPDAAATPDASSDAG